MNILKLFLLFVILMMCSCRKDYVTIKFMFNDVGHIVFPLSINDSLVYGIFDTGAQSSLIEKKEQNRIGLDTSAKKVYSFFPHTGKNPVLFQKSIKTSVSICHMQLKNPIEFSIVDGEHNLSVWGNDIIDQCNWLFDFEKDELTISFKPITFDTNQCVSIKYRDQLNLKFCSLYCKGIGLLDNVMIDSGASWTYIVNDSAFYSICLSLPDSLKDKRKRNSNLRQYTELENHKSDTIDYYFPLVNLLYHSLLIYEGCKYYSDNALFDIVSMNGILSLCYAQGYSYMYLNTTDKIIYLKR